MKFRKKVEYFVWLTVITNKVIFEIISTQILILYHAVINSFKDIIFFQKLIVSKYNLL